MASTIFISKKTYSQHKSAPSAKPFERPEIPRQRPRYAEPTDSQYTRLAMLRDIVIPLRCKSKKHKRDAITRAGFDTPATMRIYMRGGIGSFCWLRKKRCFRVQVSASQITTKHTCFPYAECVEIYP